MAPGLLFFLVLSVGVTSTMAQFNPLMFAALGGEELGENGGRTLLLYQSLLQRINALEANVRTGAVGGCESGVIGPLSFTQRQGFIRFRRPFLTPPSVSLALSDLTSVNAAIPVNFQIRPTSITRTGAAVQFTDASGVISSAYISYMACPSSSSFPLNTRG